MREVIRFKHYSIRTEEAYVQWIRRFIFFHGKRHPREMGAAHISAFLSDLAVGKSVAAATQNQALNALVFLYAQVLHLPLGDLGEFSRAQRPRKLPVVLTKDETRRVLACLKPGTVALMLRLLIASIRTLTRSGAGNMSSHLRTVPSIRGAESCAVIM